MPSKSTQYRNRITREHGSSGMDLDDKKRVRRFLYSIGGSDIQFDRFFTIRYDDTIDYVHFDIYESMTQAESKKWNKIRHPDVICQFRGRPLIVEIDGKYHKDWDSDKDYDDVKTIRYIKLNKEYLKKEGIPWEQWIFNILKDTYGCF